jgi:hypothetical protein
MEDKIKKIKREKKMNKKEIKFLIFRHSCKKRISISQIKRYLVNI